MTDDNEFTGRTFGSFGDQGYRQLDFSRLIVLGHGFERAQKIPPLGGDFPAIVIAKHVGAAENIDGWNPACETLEACAPVAAAGGEDDEVPFE